jgi:hypothetical protein
VVDGQPLLEVSANILSKVPAQFWLISPLTFSF